MCFLFKQKTAYDLRISDWSSDVCSSDLRAVLVPLGGGGHRAAGRRNRGPCQISRAGAGAPGALPADRRRHVAGADHGVQRLGADLAEPEKIGSSTWREGGCEYVYVSVVAGSV